MNPDIFSLHGKLVAIASDMELVATEISAGLAVFGAQTVLILPKGTGVAGSPGDGGHAVHIQADFRSDKSITEAADKAIRQLGGIDVLVTRFGIERSQELMDVSEADMRDEFEAVWSGLRLAQACRQSIAGRGGGVIVNLHPVSASWPAAGSGLRAMASAAGLAFSQSLALAGAAEGIRSVAISIGGRFGDEGGLTRRNLIGRKADLDEVVGVIVASASKAGGFLTATNLVVDGGELAV